MARRNYSFDANMLLDDGTTAHAAAGYGSVGGAQGIVDLGGNQGITITLPSISDTATITPQQARGDFVCVIYDLAATIAGSNLYRMSLVGSNNPAFTTGNVVLGQLQLGVGTAMDVPNAGNSLAPLGTFPAGWQYEILFTNEYANVPYQFLSLYFSGTFGSVTARAFVSVLPRE